MPDTGKMKRLFQKCTTSFFDEKETMVYPDGDLDGIAEQVLLYVEGMKGELKESEERANETERKCSALTGMVRRAHKMFADALK